MGASVFGVHPKILPEDYRSEGWKRSCVFRKNIDTIATWSVFLVHRSGSFLILISSTSKEVKGAGIIFSYYVEWKGAISFCFGATKELLWRGMILLTVPFGEKRKNTHGKTWDRCVIRRLGEGRIEFWSRQTERYVSKPEWWKTVKRLKTDKGKGYLGLH